jgi:hypothetical protein
MRPENKNALFDGPTGEIGRLISRGVEIGAGAMAFAGMLVQTVPEIIDPSTRLIHLPVHRDRK